MQTPDAVLAIGMGVKALGDTVFAVKSLIDQPTKYKADCSWCVTGALAILAVVPLAWPDLRWNSD